MSDSNSSPHISVIIPAHNEEQSLPEVLKDLPRQLIREIIVVDNAGRDRTAAVAEAAGCKVVFERQMGYGRACLAGIAALDPSTEIVVFIDGDHSDHAGQLERLVRPIIRRDYDFIIGSRILGRREPGAMAPQAYFGNKLACWLMRCFWGADYTDLGPFRAITFKGLKRLKMSDQDFGWTIEMQIKAVEHKLRTKEVPVDYRKRIGKSKFSGTLSGTLRAGEKILRTIFRYKFQKRK